MEFKAWYESNPKFEILSPLMFEYMRIAYEAGQRDMRERAAVLLDEYSSGIIGSSEEGDAIRAIKVGGE